MTFSRRLLLIWWFATRDLFQHRRSRRIAWVNLATIALLVGLSLPIYGLVLGYQQKRTEQLGRDPLALCLWLGSPNVGEPIQSDTLKQLRQAVRSRLQDPAEPRGCFGFHVLTLDWFDLEDRALSRTFRGRTLAPGDLLLESCPPVQGKRFDKPGAPGVLVSAQLLQALHASGQIPPRGLRFRFRATNLTVPVVGVLEHPLPGGLHFLFTEDEENRLRQLNPDPPVPSVLTGTLPKQWQERRNPSQLPPELRNWFEKCEVRWVGREPKGEEFVWRLSSEADVRPRLSVWRSYLEAAGRILAKEGPPPGEDFALPQPAVPLQQEDKSRAGYTQAVVYVRQLSHLLPAAQAAQALNLRPDMDVIHQMERLGKATRRAVLGVTAVIGLLAFLALWNLYVIQDLRSHQKVVEVGMLKAMGMEDEILRSVFLLQAFLLWVGGAVVGLLLGWGIGLAAETWGFLDETTGEPLTAFYAPWWLLALIMIVSGVACIVSCWLATRSARKAAPIRSLSAG